MSQVDWAMAKTVDRELETNRDCQGDWMDALAVALDLIHDKIESGVSYEKTQIVFFSSFDSSFKTCEETESAFVEALLDKKTELVVVGSNLDHQESKLPNEESEAVASLIAKVLSQYDGGTNINELLLFCT